MQSTILNVVFEEVGGLFRVARTNTQVERLAPAELAFRIRCAKHTAEDLIIGFEAAGLTCNRRNRVLRTFLERKINSIVVLGPEALLPGMKSAYTRIRSAICNGRRPDSECLGQVLPKCWWNIGAVSLFRITASSRGLPRPSVTVCEKAVKKARETFSSESVPTDPAVKSVLHRISLPLKGKINSIVNQPARKRNWIVSVTGTSASLFCSRKKGGRSALVRRAYNRSGEAPIARYDELPIPDAHRAEAQSRTVLRALEKIEPQRIRESETHAIPELGWKARVVTKSHPVLVTRGHEIRRIIYPTLRQYKSTNAALGDKPKVLRFRKVPKRACIYSADLSKATDGLSHKTLSEFCEASGIDPEIVYLHMKVDGIPITRGSFMGLPITWTILSYVHYAVCFSVDRNHNFYLKGDDLIALWTPRQIQLYEKRIGCLAPVNGSKTFIGKHYGVFCEGLYEPSVSGRDILLRLIESISVRRFFPEREVALLSLSEAAREVKTLRRRFNRIVSHQFSRLKRMCRDMHINPFLPRSLGGAGILIPDPTWEILSPVDRMTVNAVFGGLKAFDARVSGRKYDRTTDIGYLSSIVDKIRWIPAKGGPMCPHIEKHLNWCFAAAALSDALHGIPYREPRNKEILRYLKTIRPSGRGSPFKTTYGAAFEVARSMVPLRSSVMSVVKHDCD